jgi:hypothetical protein
VISAAAAENSNKFQKTRFWKGKSVEEDVVKLVGPTTAQATLKSKLESKLIPIPSYCLEPEPEVLHL